MKPSSLPWQLESILTDISRCFDSELYHPALIVALTLPEICITLTYKEKKTKVQRDAYVNWIQRYIRDDNLGVTADQCYKIRCGVVHRANAAGHAYLGADSVIFSVPGSNVQMHNVAIEFEEYGKTALMVVLADFVEVMGNMLRRWYGDHQQSQAVSSNLEGLVSWRPNGVAPFLVGTPLVASGA